MRGYIKYLSYISEYPGRYVRVSGSSLKRVRARTRRARYVGYNLYMGDYPTVRGPSCEGPGGTCTL